MTHKIEITESADGIPSDTVLKDESKTQGQALHLTRALRSKVSQQVRLEKSDVTFLPLVTLLREIRKFTLLHS